MEQNRLRSSSRTLLLLKKAIALIKTSIAETALPVIRRPLLASSVFEYLTLRSRILKDLYSFKGSPSAATGRHRPPQAGKLSGPARGSPPLILLCLEGSAAEAVACKCAAAGLSPGLERRARPLITSCQRHAKKNNAQLNAQLYFFWKKRSAKRSAIFFCSSASDSGVRSTLGRAYP